MENQNNSEQPAENQGDPIVKEYVDPFSVIKTDEQLKEIAMDLYNDKIFCDRQVDKTNLGMVFMPLIFGAFSEWKKEDQDKIGMIYEYLSEAGPMGINGMPIFYSLKFMSKEDTKKMFEIYEQYKALQELFKNTPTK